MSSFLRAESRPTTTIFDGSKRPSASPSIAALARPRHGRAHRVRMAARLPGGVANLSSHAISAGALLSGPYSEAPHQHTPWKGGKRNRSPHRGARTALRLHDLRD